MNSFHKYVHDFFRVAFCFHQMGSLTIKKIHQLSPTTNIKHHLSSKSYPPEKLTTHPSTLKKNCHLFPSHLGNFSFFFQGGPFFFQVKQPPVLSVGGKVKTAGTFVLHDTWSKRSQAKVILKKCQPENRFVETHPRRSPRWWSKIGSRDVSFWAAKIQWKTR